MRDENRCKIEAKLQEVHDWAHACLDDLTPAELHKAHEVGNQIISMLNELPCSSPVKFLAVFEALSVGADVLEMTAYRPDSSVTIH